VIIREMINRVGELGLRSTGKRGEEIKKSN
jgi:hypothetical protein